MISLVTGKTPRRSFFLQFWNALYRYLHLPPFCLTGECCLQFVWKRWLASVPIFLFIRLCFFLFLSSFFQPHPRFFQPPPPFPPLNFLSKRREKKKKKKDKQTNHKITTRLFSAFHFPLFLLFSISFLKSPGYPAIIFFAVMYIFRDRQEENLSRTRDKIASVILHTKSAFQDELIDDF